MTQDERRFSKRERTPVPSDAWIQATTHEQLGILAKEFNCTLATSEDRIAAVLGSGIRAYEIRAEEIFAQPMSFLPNFLVLLADRWETIRMQARPGFERQLTGIRDCMKIAISGQGNISYSEVLRWMALQNLPAGIEYTGYQLEGTSEPKWLWKDKKLNEILARNIDLKATAALRQELDPRNPASRLAPYYARIGFDPSNMQQRPFDVLVHTFSIEQFERIIPTSIAWFSNRTLYLPQDYDLNMLEHELGHAIKFEIAFGAGGFLAHGLEEAYIESLTSKPQAYIDQRHVFNRLVSRHPDLKSLLDTATNTGNVTDRDIFFLTVLTYVGAEALIDLIRMSRINELQKTGLYNGENILVTPQTAYNSLIKREKVTNQYPLTALTWGEFIHSQSGRRNTAEQTPPIGTFTQHITNIKDHSVQSVEELHQALALSHRYAQEQPQWIIQVISRIASLPHISSVALARKYVEYFNAAHKDLDLYLKLRVFPDETSPLLLQSIPAEAAKYPTVLDTIRSYAFVMQPNNRRIVFELAQHAGREVKLNRLPGSDYVRAINLTQKIIENRKEFVAARTLGWIIQSVAESNTLPYLQEDERQQVLLSMQKLFSLLMEFPINPFDTQSQIALGAALYDARVAMNKLEGKNASFPKSTDIPPPGIIL